MANLEAISKTNFSNKSWRLSKDYFFTAKDSTCELALAELPTVMMSMPVAFRCTNGVYSIVAIQGLQNDTNRFLSGDGTWAGSYVPMAYRNYPFCLGSDKENSGDAIFCVNTDSELIIGDDSGEPFFDKDGDLAPSLKEISESLVMVKNNLKATSFACNILLSHNLIKPWTISIKSGESQQDVHGLFCINQEALNELSDEAFVELRTAGLILVIYCQLLSMTNIHVISRLPLANIPVLSPEVLQRESDGNISFENL